MIAELLKIINELLPMLHKDEAEKILARIEKLKEKRDADFKKAVDRLADISGPDALPALNALFSELHDSL